MKLERGIRQVTCRECGAEGQVRLGATLSRGRRIKVEEAVPHLETCSHYQREQPRHLKRKGWRQQEKRMNQQMGARPTLASGAVGKDGDGRAFHQWRVEAKQTIDTKYRLTQGTWEKLVRGALLTGEEPVLHVEMNVTNDPKYSRVVIRKELWSALDPDRFLHEGDFRNALSYRLTADATTPLLVDLDPPGVMLTEVDFLALKERL